MDNGTLGSGATASRYGLEPNGQYTICTAKPENRGKGRCKHTGGHFLGKDAPSHVMMTKAEAQSWNERIIENQTHANHGSLRKTQPSTVNDQQHQNRYDVTKEYREFKQSYSAMNADSIIKQYMYDIQSPKGYALDQSWRQTHVITDGYEYSMRFNGDDGDTATISVAHQHGDTKVYGDHRITNEHGTITGRYVLEGKHVNKDAIEHAWATIHDRMLSNGRYGETVYMSNLTKDDAVESPLTVHPGDTLVSYGDDVRDIDIVQS